MEWWRLWKWFGRLLVEQLLELAVMVLEHPRYAATMVIVPGKA